MTTFNPTTRILISGSKIDIADKWEKSTKTNQSSSASPTSASATEQTNAAISVSENPIYGSKHDQAVGIKMLENLDTVPSLRDATMGGLTFESLSKAYNILMGLNNTANLSAEQKSVLEAATNAWLSQHPEDGLKLKDPTQAKTIARNVAAIFKTQILSNYNNVTTATIKDSKTISSGVALPRAKEYKSFFDQKLTLAELNQKREEIGTPTKPIFR